MDQWQQWNYFLYLMLSDLTALFYLQASVVWTQSSISIFKISDLNLLLVIDM